MTALDFLLRQFALLGYDVHKYETIINEAKEMEKEQIKNAWYNSLTKGDYHSGDEYYNETFKQQKQ
jgi:hypothetical protein